MDCLSAQARAMTRASIASRSCPRAGGSQRDGPVVWNETHPVADLVEDRDHAPHVGDGKDGVEQLALPAMVIALKKIQHEFRGSWRRGSTQTKGGQEAGTKIEFVRPVKGIEQMLEGVPTTSRFT